MAALSEVRDHHLVASIPNKAALKLIRRKGEPVAVLFKVDEQPTYLLQTRVRDIFSTVVALAYQDQGFYPRFRMELDKPARIHPVRVDWAQALSENGAEFMCETTWYVMGQKEEVTVIRIMREVETSTLLHCRLMEALPNELVRLYQSLQVAETAETP